MTIPVSYFLPSRSPFLTSHPVDWSREQLEKHDREIQSLLGNYFLRITSQAIQARMDGVSPVSLQKIYEDTASPNHVLLQATRSLPNKVRRAIDAMEMADALGAIVDVLRLVCLLPVSVEACDTDQFPAPERQIRRSRISHRGKRLRRRQRCTRAILLRLKCCASWVYVCSHLSLQLQANCLMDWVSALSIVRGTCWQTRTALPVRL